MEKRGLTTSLTRFSLYPIGRVGCDPFERGAGDGNFNLSLLPFEIVKDVYIEDVASFIRKGDFDIYKPRVGEDRVHELENMKYAIIHRYPEHDQNPDTGQYLDDAAQTERSRRLVREVAACLRIIRPITTRAQFCEGKASANGELYDIGFYEPMPNFSLPINQRQFYLRDTDAEELRFYAPLFSAAIAGSFWKFRMAVQMYDMGYFQHEHRKIRFFLWTSALEALFTSQNRNREHSGSLVAKERIKSHLGASSSVYPQGELLSQVTNPNLTVADIVDEIYCLRNHIAHGDKIPDYYYQTKGRSEFGVDLDRVDLLIGAISFIVRRSLLKILKDNLLNHFQDSGSSEAYFSMLHLTKKDISKRTPYPCPS